MPPSKPPLFPWCEGGNPAGALPLPSAKSTDWRVYDAAADMYEAFELSPNADRYKVTVLHGDSWDEVARIYPLYADGKPG